MPITTEGLATTMTKETALAEKTKPMPQAEGPDPAQASKKIHNWNAQAPGRKRGKPQCDCGAYKTK